MYRPSLKQFLELPIVVQHSVDAYPYVDAAIQDLEQGQFLAPSLLADAVYTDDRVSGVISTRLNAIFALPMEFKWQGQEEEDAKNKQPPLPAGTPAGSGSPVPDPAAAKLRPTQAPAQASVHLAPGEEEAQDPNHDDEIVALKQMICKKAEDHWEQMLPIAAMKEMTRWGILVNAGVAELVWSWDDEGDFYPTLKTWNSQFLYWRWDTRSYWLIHTDGQTEVYPGDGRWVLFAPTGHNHGWLYGAIRALAPLWLDRRFAFRDWARASEKWSVGVMKAYMPEGASDASKAIFQNSLTNMPSESLVRLPVTPKDQKFDIDMVKTDSMTGWESFDKRIERLDTCIAVCILGQNLTTEIKGAGSRAAAQVHENVRADVLKADCEVLDSMIATQVLGPWVRYNWSDEAQRLGIDWRELVPEVTHQVDPPEDKAKISAALFTVAQAAQLFSQMPDVDLRAVLDEQGIPLVEQQRVRPRPPPSPSVNERPVAPEGDVDPTADPRPDAPGPDAPGVTQPLETPADEHNVSFSLAKVPPGLKPNARMGQITADSIADEGIALAAKELARRKNELLKICLADTTYEEKRRAIKELYFDARPTELRDIVYRALVASELVGRVATNGDVK